MQSSETLIDKAVAAGYTGIAIWDSSFSYMGDSFFPSSNVAKMKQVIRYAQSKGLAVLATPAPFGDSNDALQANPNWAEAQRVVGTQFQVNSSKTQLTLVNSFPGVPNGGFESGKVDWFQYNDPGTGVDTTVAHSGTTAAVIKNAPGNARLYQIVTVKPWREYHLRLFYKTQNFSGFTQLGLDDASNTNESRLNPQFNANGTHEWTQVDYTFNSQSSTQLAIWLGVWGGSSGAIWYDDLSIEETALIYTVRRTGTPVRLYDPSAGTVYTEGTDYNTITDPRMTSTTTPFTDPWHTPPTVTLPSTTHLRAGQTVALDSYSAFPAPGINDVSLCMAEPGVLTWQQTNAAAIAPVMSSGAGFFLQYDEIRQMDSCATCKAKNMTPGQLLAWSVGNTIGVYQNAVPGAPIYVWSDMFDPYHNATASYFNVEGDLSGSWEGLPPSVTIMNWNLSNLSNSLRWFSGQNSSQPVAHEQIIAGYYDSGNGTTAATNELQQASGVPGVMGLMYTTWNDDYSQIQHFADAARAAWPTYLASLGTSGGGSGGGSSSGSIVSIVSKNSGKCLDVPSFSKHSGVGLQQYTCNGGKNQQWTLTAAASGAYEVASVNSGLAMDVSGASSSNGATVVQYTYNNTSNQHWTLQKGSDGYYTIVPTNSGKCLDVTGESKNNGAAIEQWACWGGDNQKWTLNTVQ